MPMRLLRHLVDWLRGEQPASAGRPAAPPRPRHAPRPGRRARVEEIERRVLYSAELNPLLLASLAPDAAAEVRLVNPAAAASPNVANTSAVDSASAAAQVRQHEIVFVDANVTDAQALVDAILASRHPQADIEVVQINRDANGLQQISDVLAGEQGLDAVHIVSHGASGQLLLGDGLVNVHSLQQRAAALAGWTQALNTGADLLLWGCDVATGSAGQQFTSTLAQLTGADVAASTNSTGSSALGGDWLLESEVGHIEPHADIAGQLQQGWNGLLALTAQGTETRVNTTTVNPQQTTTLSGSQIASDANGNFVVAWEDTITGYVYARLYNANGSAATGEFRVNTDVTGALKKDQPTVAMDSSGNFVVAWRSETQDGSLWGIYAQRYNPSGLAQGSEFRVNTTTSNTQERPAIAMNASGFVITWTSASQDGGGDGIYAQRYNASGVAQGGEFLVNTTTSNNQNGSDIGMDASGNFVIAWTSATGDGSGTGVFAQRYNASGVAQGGQVQINTTTSNNQTLSSVSMNASGAYVIAWTDAAKDGSLDGAYARLYGNSGTATSGEVQLATTTASYQRNASVAMETGGGFVASWTSYNQDGSQEGVYVRHYDAAGSAITAEARVNTTTSLDQQFSSVALNGSQAVVSWSGNGTGDADGVFFQRFAAGPCVLVTPTSGLLTTEAGGTAQFTVALNSAPSANVSIAVSSSEPSEGTVSTSLLTFTTANWATPQTVTVTGVDDAAVDGDVIYQVQLGSTTSTDPAYSGLAGSTVDVTNTDNEVAQSIIVSTLADTSNGDTSSLAALAANPGVDGLISLREALLAANNTATTFGPHAITFSVAGTINLASVLPTVTKAVSINGSSGGVPSVVLNGGGTIGTGLQLNSGASNSTLRGLVVQNFSSYGIRVIGASGVTIAGNYVGTNSNATAAAGNSVGIDLFDAANTTIGGTVAADRNIVSGNTNLGINLVGSSAGNSGTVVQGNYIGVSANGAGALGNTNHGVYINNSTGVTIGGSASGAGNLIGNNGTAGITLGTGASGNTIAGNTIGLNLAGSGALANGAAGLWIQGANNTVGGTSTGARNVISGNTQLGIRISGASATGNTVLGNYIGTGLGGTTDMGNGEDGIQIDTAASNNTIGGTASGARNIIAGNNNAGIAIDNVASTGNQVLGNWIGVGSNGSTLLANSHNGININGATGTLIGDGTVSGRNVVGGNSMSGVGITDGVGTVIKGNWLVNNGWDGITIQGASSTGTVIGASTYDAGGNLIAYNSFDGITLYASASSSTAATILANSIYSNSQRGIDLGDNGYDTNDNLDPDSGPNSTQNYPVLSSATSTTSGTTIIGALNSNANASYRIDFYTNRPANTDGSNGEGERWLGSTTATTDAGGNANFTATLNNAWINYGDKVTATRDLGGGTYGGTSEFALNITATASGVVVVDTMSDTSDGTTTSITNLGNARGGDGKISLREAMAAVNNTANGASADRIVFAIPPNIESANYNTALLTPTITLGSALTGMTQAVVIDGSTQPGFSSSPLVQVNGNNSVALGLQLNAGSTGSTVRGLIISNFTGDGITISSSNSNTIAGNWIGLAADGVTAAGNSDGLYVTNSSGNTIGGTSAADRNVIAGNNERGIYFSNATSNIVYGNYIGTDYTGTADVNGTTGNTLRSGVIINAGSGNQIGGTLAGQRNVISGNNHYGVEFLASTTNNTVAGNYIGTDVTGLVALGNTNGGASFWGSGTGNLLGGNTISGNLGVGVTVGSAASGATIQGNYIGLGANGNTSLGNGSIGINVSAASVNTLIGTNADGSNDAAETNVIGSNAGSGIEISGAGTSGTLVQGNYIGVDASGSLARGNAGSGVGVFNGATGNTIGGTAAGKGNVLSANLDNGVGLADAGTSSNVVQGNIIGMNATQSATLGNTNQGVWIGNGATGNTIGGTTAAAGNVITGSGYAGIEVNGASTTGNALLGNRIAGNGDLAIDLAGDGLTPNDANDVDTGANNLQNFPVMAAAITNGGSITINGRLNTSANGYYRVEFYASPTGDASGYGEASSYLGATNVATNASNNGAFAATFSAVVPAGYAVTATATASNSGYSAFTSTSEFAANVSAAAPQVPVNTAPGAQSTNEDTAKVFSTGNGNAISITDADAGGANNQITLSVTNGTLTLNGTVGLTFTNGDGTADASMTLRGTAAAINTALDGLSFAPTANYNGGAVLTLATKDSALLSLDLDTGMLGRYAFENTGYLGQDSSPASGNNAATVGTTAVVDGTRGNVVALDGSNNSNLQTSGLFGNPGSVTLAAWVNLASADTSGAEVISLGDSVLLRLDTGGKLNAAIYTGSTWESAQYTTTLAGTGWHHVAMSFDNVSKTLTLYLDGTAQAAQATTAGISYTLGANSTIGTHGNGATTWDFNGRIDDARIYNRALEPQEVAVLANDLAMAPASTVAVTVNAVNDAPSVSTTGGTLAYTEGNAATVVDSGVTVADVDGGNLASASVTISANYDSSGADALQFADQNGITGQWNASTGVLTLTGTATIAQYQTALRSVTFVNPSDTPGTANRSIAFTVSDGSASSTAATRSVSVTAVNDAPNFLLGDGLVTTSLSAGSSDFANAVAVQADGKIVAGGYRDVAGNKDFALVRYNVDGSLDASFGSGGIVTTELGGDDWLQSIQILSSGKILAAGSTTNDFAMVRYNADGSLDLSFGGGDGIAFSGLGSSPNGYAVAVLADGQLLLSGRDGNNMLVARYSSTGALDTSFGSGGSTSVDFAGGTDIAYDMVVQADGKIVLGGMAFSGTSFDAALARLTVGGALDTSFNGSGKLMIDIGTNSNDTGYALALQGDGKLLLSGWSNAAGTVDFFTVRVNTNGTLDTSFSSDGKVTTPVGAGSDLGQAVAVQADGKIVVAGQSSSNGNNFGVVRYLSDGSLDTGFGSNGVVDLNFGGSSDDRGQALALQADGKIVLAGTATVGGTYDFALARLNSDGSLDTRLDLSNSLGGSVAYTEGNAAVVLDNNATAFDAELNASGNYSGATLTLMRNGGANADDQFSASGSLGTLTTGGALVVAGTTIGTVSSNAAGSLVLAFNSSATGTLVNSAMRQIAYRNASDTPPASLQIDWTFSDSNSGAQGSGGALSATGSTTVNITAVNDAPVATITPASYAATEQTLLSLKNNGLAISDVDAASGTVTVTLSVTEGTLTATAGSSGAVVSNSGTATVTLTGTVAQINALLNTDGSSTVGYTNGSDAPSASATLTLQVNDGGNTGTGGALTASNTATVNITAVNDAPVLADTALALTLAEDAGLPSGAVGALVSAFTGGISDVDSAAAKGIAVTATDETNGTWYFSTNGGSSWAAVGTVSAGASLLLADDGNSRLYFAPAANWNGTSSAALTLHAWDRTSGVAGNKVNTASTGGSTAFSTVSDTVDVSVTAVNDVPVNTAPATLSANEDGALQLTGLSITDPDAGSSSLRSELTVSQGTLSATSGAGVMVSGSGSTTLVLTGTLADLNAYLASGAAPVYSPVANANGSVTLQMVTSDGLNTGTGGAIDSARLDYRFQDGTPAGSNPDLVSAVGGITGVATNLSVSGLATALSGSSTSFGVIYTGAFDITTGGSYTFGLNADDAARVVIDGTPLSLAWFGAASDTLGLAAGRHSLELRYAQDVGGLGLAATISGPDTGGSATNLLALPGMGRLVSATASTSINIAAVNDAPVLADTVLSMTVPEDAGAPSGAVGALISTLSSGISDIDAAAVKGIAVVATDESQGSWYFSQNNGSSWAAVGAVNSSSALLLADNGNTRLYFAPSANVSGSVGAALTLRGWDQTSGAAGSKVSTASNGGTTAFSSATDTLAVVVTAVNDAPTLVDGTVLGVSSTDEDTPSYSVAVSTLLFAVGTADTDSGALQGLAITAVTGNGNWQYSTDGSTWTNVGAVSTGSALLLDDASSLRYVPDGQNGETTTLAFRAWDQTSGGASNFGARSLANAGASGGSTAFSTGSATVERVIDPVNDAPTISNGTTVPLAGTDENTASSGTTVTGILAGTGWADVDLGALQGIAVTAVVGNGTWQYSTDGSSWTSFGVVSGSNALLLAGGTQVRYLPDLLNAETASFNFRAWDQTSGSASVNGTPSSASTASSGGSTAFSSQSASTSLAVTASNDAPTVTNGAVVTLTGTDENTTSSTTTVASILAGAGWADVDSGALQGIAVTAATGNGTWQYSTNGSTWTSFGALSSSSALLLAGGTQVRYLPDGLNAETASISFRAWDQTSGSASVNGTPSTASTVSNGGSTAFSSQSASASLAVTAVNDAPTVSNGSVVTLTGTGENTTSSSTTVASILAGAGWADVDSGALQGIAVTAATANGTWQYSTDGSSWTSFGALSSSSALLLNASSLVRYVPDGLNAETASISFRAWDQTSGSASVNGTPSTASTASSGGSTAFSSQSASTSLAVSAVNDAPTVTNGAVVTFAGTDENTASTTTTVASILASAGWADVDSGALQGIAVTATTGNGTWQYSTNGSSWTSFGAVSGSGALLLAGGTQVRYLPDGLNAETASFSFRAWDQTSGSASINGTPSTASSASSGGSSAFSSQSASASLAVTAINDAPTVSNGAVVTLAGTDENTTSTTTTVASILASAGWADVDSGALQGIAITAATGNGSWQYSTDGSSWTSFGAVGSSSALLLNASSLVRYVPDNLNAEAVSFNFRAWDQTSGSASANSSPAYANPGAGGSSMAFSSQVARTGLAVTAVNDAPSVIGGAAVALAGTDENTASAGTTVAAILAGAGQADVDTGAQQGLAITATTGAGLWQYSTDGITWTSFGAVAGNHALLLSAGSQVRYVPDGQNSETATLSVQAWDRSSGSPSANGTPAYADAGLSGGSTAFSSASASASLAVSAVNDAPSLLSGSTTSLAGTDENAASAGTLVSSLLASAGWADVDAGALGGIAITAANGNGQWQYSTDGSTWTSWGSVSTASALLLDANSQVRYLPDQRNAETVGFSFLAWDQTSGSASANALPARGNAGLNGGSTAFSTATASTSLLVTAVNDAPMLTSGVTVALSATDENSASAGTLVSSLLASAGWADVDAGALGGIALTAATGNGNWQYSTDGSTWASVGAVGAGNALLLAASSQVRYVPDSQNAETATLSFQAWDQTSGSGSSNALRSLGDARMAGSSTAFSSQTAAATVAISPVNDAPTLLDGSTLTLAGTDENTASSGTLVSSLLTSAGWADVDTGALSGVAITAATGNGQWQFSTDGGSWTAFGAVGNSSALLLDATSQVRYQPDGQNGETAGFSFVAWDQTSGSASSTGTTRTANPGAGGGTSAFASTAAQVAITVGAVNDAPTLNPGALADLPATDEDQAIGATQVSSLLAAVNQGDVDQLALGGIAVTSSTGLGRWQYSTDGSQWTDIGTVQAGGALLLDAGSQLRYLPDGQNAETASIAFRAWDQTQGTASAPGQPAYADTQTSGGSTAYSVAQAGARVQVAAVNDAPVITAGAVVILTGTDENTPSAGTTVASLLASAGWRDVDAGALGGVAITAASGQGGWQYSSDGVSWTAWGSVAETHALLLDATTQLRYVPDGQNAEVPGFSFRAWDRSSAVASSPAAPSYADATLRGAATAFSSQSASASLAVSAVNDAPLLTQGATVALAGTDEDTASPATPVSSLLAGAGWADVDLGALGGIALTGTQGQGQWQYSSDGSSWASVGAVSAGNALLLAASSQLRYLPDSLNAESADISFQAWDLSSGIASTTASPAIADARLGGGSSAFSSASASASLVVTAVNDAPRLIPGTTVTLPGTDEDQASPPTAVSTLLSSAGLADADTGAVGGIAITSVGGYGQWQYSTDGRQWTAVGAVNGHSALLLDASSLLRYLPDSRNGETASFSFAAWDQTRSSASTPGAPAYANPGAGGGSSAFSLQQASALVTVSPVNDAPTLAAGATVVLAATDEDTPSAGQTVASLLARAGHADVDQGALGGIALSATTGRGQWQYSTDGSSWTVLGPVDSAHALLLDAASQLRYVPDGQNDELASFSFTAWDQSSGQASVNGTPHTASLATVGGTSAFASPVAQATLVVTAVNDAPTLRSGVTITLGGTDEDTASPSTSVASLLAQASGLDVDNNARQGLAITATLGLGRWQFSSDGQVWTDVGAVGTDHALLLDLGMQLRYQPDGRNGETAGFSFRAWDETAGQASTAGAPAYGSIPKSPNAAPPTAVADSSAYSAQEAQVVMPVGALNDAPILGAGSPVDLAWADGLSAASGVTVADLLQAAAVQDVDAGASGGLAVTTTSGTGTWQYSMDGTRWSAFGGVQTGHALLLGPAAQVRYVPNGSTSETATFEFKAWDQTAGQASSTGSPSYADAGGSSSAEQAYSSRSRIASIMLREQGGALPAPPTPSTPPASGNDSAKDNPAATTNPGGGNSNGNNGGNNGRNLNPAVVAVAALPANDAPARVAQAQAQEHNVPDWRKLVQALGLPGNGVRRETVDTNAGNWAGGSVDFNFGSVSFEVLGDGGRSDGDNRFKRAGSASGRGGNEDHVELDSMASAAPPETPASNVLLSPIGATGATMTAGLLFWLTRGGGMLASVLMGVPAWRHIDLLPVVARTEDERNDEDAHGADAEDSAAEAAEAWATPDAPAFAGARAGQNHAASAH